jgi:cellulose synthase/poly-beta-1,6-N-acetylglucosamine synthase-like glycosyltransferase
MDGGIGQFAWTICYFTVLIGLSVYGVHRYFIVYQYLKHRRRPMRPQGTFAELPRVTVQLPLYNECHVAIRLLDAVAKLDYPKDRLQIQVLDDSTDETQALVADRVKGLAADGVQVMHVHRIDRTGFKAGALDHGLATADGEFILILDADFVPPPELLLDTIHHFTDPQVGMIQTRWGHLNRTYSVLTRVQAMFLDGHLLLEQTARSRSGRFFNFNGTAGVWRKRCIEEAGGWQHDTLTEDLDLSYRAQLAGWKFVFLPDVVTPAELPVEMNGFKSQQHRWTKGSIQTCKKLLPRIWASRLSLPVKIEATAHLTSNFSYLLLAFLCVLLHPSTAGPESTVLRIVLLDIPIFLAATVSAAVFYVCAQRELHPRTWHREILYLPVLLALGIGMSLNNARAVLEAVFNRQSEFTRTPKYGIEHKGQSWRAGRYLPIKSMLFLLEAAFAIYFSYFVLHALANGQYLSVPFLLLFAGGFAYVAFASFLQGFGFRAARATTPSPA